VVLLVDKALSSEPYALVSIIGMHDLTCPPIRLQQGIIQMDLSWNFSRTGTDVLFLFGVMAANTNTANYKMEHFKRDCGDMLFYSTSRKQLL
jgi:hypothetical protein